MIQCQEKDFPTKLVVIIMSYSINYYNFIIINHYASYGWATATWWYI